MYLLPYVIFREMYLMGIREYVSLRPMEKNWADAHIPGDMPNIAGC